LDISLFYDLKIILFNKRLRLLFIVFYVHPIFVLAQYNTHHFVPSFASGINIARDDDLYKIHHIAQKKHIFCLLNNIIP